VNHEGNKFGTELQDATPLPDGVDKYESHRWQLEAKVPEEKFNEWVDENVKPGNPQLLQDATITTLPDGIDTNQSYYSRL
jgi:hypothetical protein